MTDPTDPGPSGVFDHLDDPAAPTPGGDVLSAVVHRGRRIRARRQGMFAAAGAAAVTATVLGGLGLSHAVNAARDSVVTPTQQLTPEPSVSAALPRHHRPGLSVLVPGAGPITGSHRPTPAPSASSGECGAPAQTQSPSPLPSGPIVQPVVPPLLPTASPVACPSESPSPAESPSPSQTPSPAESATPTPTPSAS